MKLQNISNKNKTITLFCRNDDGSQEIKLINNYLPYYYEPSQTVNALGYDGVGLQKLYTNKPSDIRKQSSNNSYSSDIHYVKKYILDEISLFEPSPTRIVFFDIEVKADELPHPKEDQIAPYPISCITIYDNYSKKYETFFIEDYPDEFSMLSEFCDTVKIIAPDILTAWNVDFDYFYLYYRYPGFAQSISPISEIRWKQGIDYPAGISIIDMLGAYHKLTFGSKESYSLMAIANEELGYEIKEDTDFTNIQEAKTKNKLDVKKLVELDQKVKLFDFYDEIRILSKCLWEDLPSERQGYQWQSNNSKIIDMLALDEAKKLNVILPDKSQTQERAVFEGAFREVQKTGLYKNLKKVDLAGAYPQAIVDFCLSPENFVDEPTEDTLTIPVWSRATEEKSSELIATYYVKQNPNAILPSLVRRLLDMKNKLKTEMKSVPKESDEYKMLEVKYDSRKRIVNSAYGVIGNPYFRLYDKRVAETITFLIRDVLQNTKEKLLEQGFKPVYFDTDSVFCEGDENLVDLLNQWVYQWGVDKFNNPNINIEFDYEGEFSSIFIVALCRYIGRLETAKGQKVEIKGIEMKRRDTSNYTKKMQEKLLNMILDEENKETILNWIQCEIDNFNNNNVIDIAIPCKLAKKINDYKSKPIWVRALENTVEFFSATFTKSVGDKYYYIYVKDKCGVLALSSEMSEALEVDFEIDYIKMLERNILNKLENIFVGMGWEIEYLNLCKEYNNYFTPKQLGLILERFENKEVMIEKFRKPRKKKQKLDT